MLHLQYETMRETTMIYETMFGMSITFWCTCCIAYVMKW
jgi:hypothetical protein